MPPKLVLFFPTISNQIIKLIITTPTGRTRMHAQDERTIRGSGRAGRPAGYPQTIAIP